MTKKNPWKNHKIVKKICRLNTSDFAFYNLGSIEEINEHFARVITSNLAEFHKENGEHLEEVSFTADSETEYGSYGDSDYETFVIRMTARRLMTPEELKHRRVAKAKVRAANKAKKDAKNNKDRKEYERLKAKFETVDEVHDV